MSEITCCFVFFLINDLYNKKSNKNKNNHVIKDNGNR